ncbi:MAG: type II secretion system F family protein [Planctomycetota bacterium]
MTAYAYTAVALGGGGGAPSSGTREASDEKALRSALRDEGLIAIEVKPVRAVDALRARTSADRVRQKDGAWFFSTMAMLLENAVPVDEAVRSAQEAAPTDRASGICERVRAGLRKGESFSGAVEGVEGLARAQHIALLRSGESSGRLAYCVGLVDASIERASAIRRTLMGRLTYPALLLVASIAAVWYLSAVVVPSFAETLAELGGELPWQTRATLGLASVLSWLAPVVVGVVVLAVLTRPVWMTSGRRRWLDRMVLRVPVAGSLVWYSNAALVTDILATMIEGGSDLLDGLTQAHEVVTSREIGARLATARARVREGADAGVVLAESGVMPAMASTIVRAGLAGGDLSGGLRRASRFCLVRQEAMGERVLTLLEPAVLVVMAGAVGWVAYSLIAGMLAITNAGGL